MIEVPQEDRDREQRLVEVREWVDRVWPHLEMVALPADPHPADYQAALNQRIREVHQCRHCVDPVRATSAYVQHKLGEYARWLDLCLPCSFWMTGQDVPPPERLAELQRLAWKPPQD